MSNEYCYDRENKNLLVRFSSDGTIEKYVYGNGLIASYETYTAEESSSTNYQAYIYDIRGSVTEVVDVSGSVTAEYRYSTYGDRDIISGAEFDELGYCARDGVLTEASGLLYMRARYYYPTLMRFINEDIVTGDISNSASLNRYAYVNGNPITLIDPFGLCAEKYDASDIYVWSSGNFQSYLSVLGFYSGKNDYNLFSDDTQKALRNFARVYGLNKDEKLGNILSKVIEAHASTDNALDELYPGVHNADDYTYNSTDEIAYGIIQWRHKERKPELEKIASKKEMDLSVSDINAQLALLRQEMDVKKKKEWMNNSFRKESNPKDAAVSFNYMLIQGGSLITKQDMAKSIYDTFVNY